MQYSVYILLYMMQCDDKPCFDAEPSNSPRRVGYQIMIVHSYCTGLNINTVRYQSILTIIISVKLALLLLFIMCQYSSVGWNTVTTLLSDKSEYTITPPSYIPLPFMTIDQYIITPLIQLPVTVLIFNSCFIFEGRCYTCSLLFCYQVNTWNGLHTCQSESCSVSFSSSGQSAWTQYTVDLIVTMQANKHTDGKLKEKYKQMKRVKKAQTSTEGTRGSLNGSMRWR